LYISCKNNFHLFSRPNNTFSFYPSVGQEPDCRIVPILHNYTKKIKGKVEMGDMGNVEKPILSGIRPDLQSVKSRVYNYGMVAYSCSAVAGSGSSKARQGPGH